MKFSSGAKNIFFTLIFMLLLMLFSGNALAASQTPIMGSSQVSDLQMIKYFNDNGGVYPYAGSNLKTIDAFVAKVISEAQIENIRADVAFAQMMKETNFLKFTGTVQAYQNNFGGLGVTGQPGVIGETFPDVETGIRAMIQHLKAYASNAPLNQVCVDPRYNYVYQTAPNPPYAPYVEWLGIPDNPYGKGWAASAGYGYDILNRVSTMKSLLPTIMWLDSPGSASTVKGVVNVSGWALSSAGVSTITVNTAAGVYNVTNKTNPRADVGSIFPLYPNSANSGFSYPLDTTKLPNGWQTITVVVTGANSEKVYKEIWINVQNPPMIMWVDTPYYGSTVRGTVNVSGWVLTNAGVSSVKVNTAAGNYDVTNATIARGDVYALFSAYTNAANSGFSYNLDTTALPNGLQTITIAAKAGNNDTIYKTIWINVDNSPKLWLDSPYNMSTVSGSVLVSGWSLNISGISTIKVYTANAVYDVTDKALPRGDVNSLYPGYLNSPNSGFAFPLDTKKLPTGWQTITIIATGNNGAQVSKEIWINVKNSPPLLWVDSPGNRTNIKKDETATISGWTLFASGIASIKLQTATGLYDITNISIPRPDVNAIYPGYNSINSGFSYQLDTTPLPIGWQTITIIVKGNNGDTTTQMQWVNVIKRKVVIDPGHGGLDPGAVANNLEEANINLPVALKLRDILISNGYDVVMTRSDDSTVSLDSRVNITNASSGDIFVSIHSDASTNTSATGVLGTYYGSNDPADPSIDGSAQALANAPLSLDLANRIASSVATATSQNQRPTEDHRFYVCRYNNMPSTLVELGFLTNPTTATAMATDSWQTTAATAIAAGINSYFAAHL